MKGRGNIMSDVELEGPYRTKEHLLLKVVYQKKCPFVYCDTSKKKKSPVIQFFITINTLYSIPLHQ